MILLILFLRPYHYHINLWMRLLAPYSPKIHGKQCEAPRTIYWPFMENRPCRRCLQCRLAGHFPLMPWAFRMCIVSWGGVSMLHNRGWMKCIWDHWATSHLPPYCTGQKRRWVWDFHTAGFLAQGHCSQKTTCQICVPGTFLWNKHCGQKGTSETRIEAQDFEMCL